MSAPGAAILPAEFEVCLQLWAAQLASVLSLMSGRTLLAQLEAMPLPLPVPTATGQAEDVWVLVQHRGGVAHDFSGRLAFQLSGAGAVVLIRQFTGEGSDPASTDGSSVNRSSVNRSSVNELSANEFNTGEFNAGEISAGEISAGEIGVSETDAGEIHTDDAALCEFNAEHREALLELFRQTGGLVGDGLKAGHGEIHLEITLGPAPDWAAVQAAELKILEGETLLASAMVRSDAKLAVSLSSNLAATVRSADTAPSGAKAATGQAESARLSAPGIKTALGTAKATNAARESGASNLDLLRNVHLSVALRFGQRRMALREILDFCAGTVIELDQQVEDPVDLLLEEKVIARGEVVVVEGSYGLRVTEIISTPLSGETK